MAGKPPVGYAISLKQGNFTSDPLFLNPCPIPVLGKHRGAILKVGLRRKAEAALGKAVGCRGRRGNV